MALDTAESIQIAFAGLQVGEAILAAVQGLPPKATRKFVDYGPILDLVKEKLLPLIDQVEADLKT